MAHKTRGTRTNYPSDVSDEEWAFCAPDASQRDYSMRAIFNALRYMVPGGLSLEDDAQRSAAMVWRPATSPTLDQAGCSEAMAHDLRKVLRLLAGGHTEPSAVSPAVVVQSSERSRLAARRVVAHHPALIACWSLETEPL